MRATKKSSAKKPRIAKKKVGKSTVAYRHSRVNKKTPRGKSIAKRGKSKTMTLKQMFNEVPFSENPPAMTDRRQGTSASRGKSPAAVKSTVAKKGRVAKEKRGVKKVKAVKDEPEASDN